jgi:hypothetical protein
MTLRASADPGRGRGHLPGRRRNLEPGKAHGYEGYEAAPGDLLASPERSEVCAMARTGIRAET